MDRQKDEQVSSRKVYKSSRTVYKGWAVQDLKYLPSMKELLQRFPSIRCRKSTRAASQCRGKSPSAWGPPRIKCVPKMVSPVRCPSQVSQCVIGGRFLQLLARQRRGGVSGSEKEWVLYCIKYTYSSQFNHVFYEGCRRFLGAFLDKSNKGVGL